MPAERLDLPNKKYTQLNKGKLVKLSILSQAKFQWNEDMEGSLDKQYCSNITLLFIKLSNANTEIYCEHNSRWASTSGFA